MTLKTLLQRFIADFEHFHRNADVGEVHRDTAAHQAGADRGGRLDVLLRRFRRYVGNPRGLSFGEEDVNHRGALRMRQALLEIVAFDFHAGVEAVDLHRGLHALVRHLAVELAAQPAREKRLGFLEDRGVGAIGEHLVVLVAYQWMLAALRRFALRECDGAGDQVALKDLVDDAEAQRVFGFERIAGQDRVHRRLRADQSRQALRAAAARQQADLDFRQAYRRARRRDAIVAGEREFESAAECGAVDRGDDRFRALFDVSAGRPLRLFIGTGRLAEVADVGAGDERATLPGDDDRFDRVVAQRRFEVFRQVEPDAAAKGIDRRIVDGQQRDAIANFVVNSADKGHGSPRG